MSEQYFSNKQNEEFMQHASTEAKQEFLIFSIMVAGKPADRTWNVVKKFLAMYDPENPFKTVQWMIDNNRLNECLQEARTGQYTRLQKALPELIKLDPENVTIEELENIHGIGKKTSRFYKLYTDSNFQGIPLDTHLLKFLRDIGYDTPKNTPQSTKRYEELEQILIDLYEIQKPTYGLKTLQEFDYHIWYNYYKDNKQKQFMIKSFKDFKDELKSNKYFELHIQSEELIEETLELLNDHEYRCRPSKRIKDRKETELFVNPTDKDVWILIPSEQPLYTKYTYPNDKKEILKIL